MILLLLFVLVPLVELWLLLQVGAVVGAGPTLGLVILTGVVGASLARREGLRTMQQMMDVTSRGEVPHAHLLHAMAIFLGGALLLTPGILTDVLGFSLLIPQTRALLEAYIMRWFQRKVASGAIRVQTHRMDPTDYGSPPPPSPLKSDRIYDQNFDDDSTD